MAPINLERYISRGMARSISRRLDLAGLKMSVDQLLWAVMLPALAIIILTTIYLGMVGFQIFLAFGLGLLGAVILIAFVYFTIEYKIDQRKTRLERMLPDFLQIVAANLRSGVSLERAMLMASRSEFSFLSEDVREVSRRVFGGETLEDSLQDFAKKYRSYQLRHAIKMIIEALKYGGAMADLITSLAKDMRDQQMVQKDVAGQMVMYSIFVMFAGLIVAPVLYGLTTQMIVITTTVWSSILQSNPGGLPTTGVAFLRPSPPQITADEYRVFAYLAIILTTGFASLIMSAISSGSPLKGLRLMPVFIAIGLIIYFVVQTVIGGFFASLGTL